MAFIDTADLAYAASYRARVKVALVTAAAAILNEPIGDMSEVHYDKRTAMASNVLRDPEGIVSAFIWPILGNPAIAKAGLDVPDVDLQYVIAMVWDAVAGVKRTDKTVPAPPEAPEVPEGGEGA